MKSLEVNDSNFEQTVLKSDKPMLVDFGADWCPPCRTMSSVVDELAADLDGKALVGKLDVDANPNFTARYGIRNLPTFLIFKAGTVVDKVVGAVPKSILAKKLSQLL